MFCRYRHKQHANSIMHLQYHSAFVWCKLKKNQLETSKTRKHSDKAKPPAMLHNRL